MPCVAAGSEITTQIKHLLILLVTVSLQVIMPVRLHSNLQQHTKLPFIISCLKDSVRILTALAAVAYGSQYTVYLKEAVPIFGHELHMRSARREHTSTHTHTDTDTQPVRKAQYGGR